MINQENIHLLNSLQKLEAAGFTDQVVFREEALINLSNSIRYEATEIKLCHEFRFEGMTNPDDESILFALEFADGRRGTLAAPYGPYADPDLFEFLGGLECNTKNRG